MNWKYVLKKLEETKQWDEAIEFMEEIIRNHPNDHTAYLSMMYLLINLLVEEQFDRSKHDYYQNLSIKYFQESYQKFSNNAEYLFFTGIMAHMAEWYFDIEIENAIEMIVQAAKKEPKNSLYRWGFYSYPDMTNTVNRKLGVSYAKNVIAENSIYMERLKSLGSLGRYVLEIIKYDVTSNSENKLESD